MIRQNPFPCTRRHFLWLAGASLAVGGTDRSHAQESTSKIPAAVIGHTGRGDYGHGLDGIFQRRDGVELVAVADPVPEGRKRVVNKLGARVRQYDDYNEMLSKERPRLVSVAMRHADQHFEIVRAALRSGAHVYCEKPFTTTPAEADELLREANRRQLKIAVAHTMRMMPVLVRLRAALREGFIGQVVELRAFGKQDARAGGEDMMVLGSHLFDLMRFIAGDPLWCTARVLWRDREITANDGRSVQDNVGPVAGDRVFAQFAFPGKVHASFTSAPELRETVGPWGVEIYGSGGVARIHCDLAPNVFVRKGGPWKSSGKTDSWEPFSAEPRSASEHNLGPVGDWLEAIAKNREPECSGRNGAWAVEMVMGVYRAALTGNRTVFPLTQRNHPLLLEKNTSNK